ncbi:alpha/beta hydrolase [Idiomarina xiamenensis]|uniref:Alpha/beta hydrolase n=1 Tax=Idiomarina xiamenensis 10-D-4 TaxID=740709 RepID=K2K5G4_9GAMM|nr:alpha/beta hydrolase [Idiomarina xiamenensis]EKE82823.1 alpha/beta hydrolase [Idiomarina xiamenensis 10-D-4]
MTATTLSVEQLAQAQQDAEPVSFQLPWGCLRGLRWGPQEQVPQVLALHGWQDNAASFIPLAAALPAEVSLLALDFAGHGHSDKRPRGVHYHFVDYVYDSWSVLQQLGIAAQSPLPLLLGHSMGGYVATMLASLDGLQQAETGNASIQQLVSVEAYGLLAAEADDTVRQLQKGMQSRFNWEQKAGLQATPAQQSPPRPLSRSQALSARAAVADFEECYVALLVDRALQAVDDNAQRFVWRTDRAVRTTSPYRFVADQVTSLMRHIACPMHVIRGEQGFQELQVAQQRWPLPASQCLQQCWPGGHHVHMQQGPRLAELIVQLLRN